MHITPSMVNAIISKLDPHKLCRIEGILVIDLKKCAPELVPVLSKLDDKRLATS